MRGRDRRGSIRRLAAIVAFALFLGAPTSRAIPLVPDFSTGPVVFDFEDGLQGWQFLRGADRVETSVLGGSYAVLGGDRDRIRLELDLTGLETLTLEQLWVSKRLTENLVWVLLFRPDGDGGFVTRPELGVAAEPETPDVRLFDVSGFTGMGGILIIWDTLACIPEDPCPPFGNFVGYIDNIALTSIPEPSTLVLTGLGLGALAWRGRLRL